MNKFSIMMMSALALSTQSIGTSEASRQDKDGLVMFDVGTKSLMRPDQEATQIQAKIDFWQPEIQKARSQLEILAGTGMKHVPSLEEFSRTVNHELEEGNYDLLESYPRDHKKVDENSTLDEIIEAFKHAYNCHWTLEANDDRLDQMMAILIYNHATHRLGRISEVVESLKKKHQVENISLAEIVQTGLRPIEKAAEDTILRLKNKRAQVRKARESRKYVDFLQSLIADLSKDEPHMAENQQTE